MCVAIGFGSSFCYDEKHCPSNVHHIEGVLFFFLTKFVFSDRFLIHLRLLELSRRNYVLGKLTQGGCG